MNYLGSECPVCRIKLVKGQDIVVCPECGAPYHRPCYVQSGQCIFSDKHKDGFEYKIPKVEKVIPPQYFDSGKTENESGEKASPSPNTEGGNKQEQNKNEQEGRNGILCPKCKTVNDSQNIFCENCGAPLHNSHANPRPSSGQFAGFPGFDQNLKGEIDGVPKADLYEFYGPSADTYMYRTVQQHINNSKVTFMASPVLFSPFYFAYRKMWGWAALSLVLTLLFAVPTFLIMLADGGNEALVAIKPNVLEYLRFGADILNLLTKLAFGFFSLYFYRKSCVKKIKTLLENGYEGPHYREMLKKQGGVSQVGLIIMIALIFVLSYILSYFFGDSIMNYVFGMA